MTTDSDPPLTCPSQDPRIGEGWEAPTVLRRNGVLAPLGKPVPREGQCPRSTHYTRYAPDMVDIVSPPSCDL